MLEKIYEKNPPHPGFRISMSDIIVLIVGVIGGIIAYPYYPELAPLLPVIIFHFFLFCNVFRVWRWYEMSWGALFIANFTLWAYCTGTINWTNIMLTQLPITLTVITITIASKYYHGIFCKKLPSKVDLRSQLGPVLDQGNLGSSTSCAITSCLKKDTL